LEVLRLLLLAPDRVDDLVLQDSGEPSLEARLARKAARERRQQGFLDDVLGEIRVAELQLRYAE